MQVAIENPLNGMREKAICVQTEEPQAGIEGRYIAVQLVKSCNIWGLQDPPADWLTGEPTAQSLAPQSPLGPISFQASTPSSLETPMPELERRAGELQESLLMTLRQQTAGIQEAALREFESRLKVMQSEAQTQPVADAEQAVAEAVSSIEQRGRAAAEKLTAHFNQLMGAIEEGLRTRLSDLLLPLVPGGANVAPK